MANKTFAGLTETASAAAADLVPIWVAASSVTRRITKANFIGATLTGGGTIATGGYTLTVPATGTVALIGGGQTFSVAPLMQAGIGIGVAGSLLQRPAAGVIRQALEFVALADNGTIQLSSRSRGLVFVESYALGETALYLIGASVTLLAGNATYFGTAADTASKLNVYVSGGAIVLQNKRGTANTVSAWCIS